MDVVWLKLGLAIALLGLMYACGRAAGRLRRLPVLGRSILAPWIVFRAVPFAGVYLLFGRAPTSDVTGYFWPQALAAASGEVVYRDFTSHYAPVFPYLLGLSVTLWRDPRAIVLLMMAVELVALVVTVRGVRRDDAGGTIDHAPAMYLASPAPLIFVVLGGQEDVWMWLGGAAMLLAPSAWSRAIAGGGAMLVTKPLFLLPLVWGAWRAPKAWSYVLILGAIGTIAGAILWRLAGPAVFEVLREGRELSPPNLWLLLDPLMGGRLTDGNTAVLSAVALASGALVGSVLLAGAPPTSFTSGAAAWTAAWCVVMVLSPKSLGNYAALFLMPLTFATVRTGARIDWMLLGVLNVTAAVHPSLWYRLGSPRPHSLRELDRVAHVIEFGMEGVMVAVILLVGIRAAARVRRAASVSRPSAP